MKPQPTRLEYTVASVKLYREDVEEILQSAESVGVVRISTDASIYDSTAEFLQERKRFRNVKFVMYNPLFIIDLNKHECSLRCDAGDLQHDGLFQKIRGILQRRRRLFYGHLTYSRRAFINLLLWWSLAFPAVGLQFRISPLVELELVAFSFIASLIVNAEAWAKPSRVILDQSKDGPSWVERNGETIVAGCLAGLATAIISQLVVSFLKVVKFR